MGAHFGEIGYIADVVADARFGKAILLTSDQAQGTKHVPKAYNARS
jgi:hypothetical protein